MNFTTTIKEITNGFNLRQEDVLKVVYADIEQAINTFREEIRLAENVETLEFLRRHIWDRLFAEKGAYYDLCKRSPMLKILRLNADIRYFDLLKQKRRNEDQQITYQIIKSSGVQTRRQIMRAIVADQKSDADSIVEVDGELSENEITYTTYNLYKGCAK
jgi:hypothetical protein